jgi:hypothetical protein
MNFTFKYYKPSLLISLVVSLVGIISFGSAIIATNYNWTLPLGTSAIISLVFLVYDQWVWKKAPVLLNVTNISGRYEGQLFSSYRDADGNAPEIDVAIEITQTSSDIHIRQFNRNRATGKQTESNSDLAMICKERSGFPRVKFSYQNDGESSQENLTIHEGFCSLSFSTDNSISGRYFTNRNGGLTSGDITAKFTSKTLKGAY